MQDLNRRGLLGAAALAAPVDLALAREPKSLKGLTISSESIQMSANTDDGATGFTVRLCRYPTIGVAWIWAQVYEPGRIWCYSDDQLTTTTRPSDLAAERVGYIQTDGASLDYRRQGPRATPRTASLEGVLSMRQGSRVGHGPGGTPVTILARLEPTSARAGLLPDRTEAKGLVHAAITLGGRRLTFSGYGSFHEQPQSAPRFVDPFVYFRGTGDGIGMTFTRGVKGSGGYLIVPGKSEIAASFEIGRPGRRRRYQIVMEGGRVITGDLEQIHQFGVRIYDDWRESQIIRGSIDGRPFVGAVNDWLGARLTYLDA